MQIQNAWTTSNRNERELTKINKYMSRHFEDTFNTEDVLLNDKPIKLMIIKDTDNNVHKKKIKSKKEDVLKVGDYVFWNNQFWLITVLDSDNKTWNRGYMYLCTLLLRWQNENGDIIERWCYAEDFTKYSTGVKYNKLLMTGDNQYGITIPIDEETKYIKRDRRFVIDIDGVYPPDIYKLSNRKTFLTDMSYSNKGGLLNWTFTYDTFNSKTDKLIEFNNKKIVIPDYIDKSENNISNKKSGIVSVINGREDIKVNYKRSYTVNFYDNNIEIPYSNVNYNWNIKSNFNEKLITNIIDNTIEIYVCDETLIDEIITLQVLVDGKLNNELVLKIKSIF